MGPSRILISFLEQTIEGRARIGRRGFGWARGEFIREEEVTKICFLPIGHPLGLRLPTLVVCVRVEVCAVEATVNISRAMRAIIGSRNVAFNLELAMTLMADHRRSND